MTDPKKRRGAGLAAVFRENQAATLPSKEAEDVETGRHTGMPAKQHDGVVKENSKPIKATYYIDPTLIKPLKFLSVAQETDLSSLVNEALRDLLAKHNNSVRHCYSTS